MQLPTIALPLPPNGPPSGYEWEDRSMSDISTSTAFNTGINNRDRFLGDPRCVVCGIRSHLRHCHIIEQSEHNTWTDLKDRNWVPSRKKYPEHEARNGLLLCPNHHEAFAAYFFFIRFFPDIRMFVLVNYSDVPDLRPFHGKAIGLDIDDLHAPFPSIFIIHEMRVRGSHPFQALQPRMPAVTYFQDWIYSDRVWDDKRSAFKRIKPRRGSRRPHKNKPRQPRIQRTTAAAAAGASASGTRKLEELNAGVIADILAATRAMPSWRACQMENTGWDGTAEENIRKYVSSIGVEDAVSNAADEN